MTKTNATYNTEPFRNCGTMVTLSKSTTIHAKATSTEDGLLTLANSDMRLIGIEIEGGLLFKGGHARIVSEVTNFRTDDAENCMIPGQSLFWVLPRLIAHGHSVGILNPFAFIPKKEY